MANNTRTVVLQRGAEQLQLAVNPRQMVISQPQNTLRYVTVQGETVHAAGGQGLTQVTLSTFLPGVDSRFYQGVSPTQALAMLRRWKEEGLPVELLISGSELGARFLICGLEQTLTEGDRDVGLRLSLQEYKYVAAALQQGQEGPGPGGLYLRAEEREQVPVYVTAGGEDLWTVARLYLGDGSRWKELAEKNGIDDPHDLPRGKELVLL